MVAYATQCANVGFPSSVQALGPGTGDCNRANLVDPMLASPTAIRSGYEFNYSPGGMDSGGHVVRYTITAEPITQNSSGIRHFFVDETGVIRYTTGGPATADSPPLE